MVQLATIRKESFISLKKQLADLEKQIALETFAIQSRKSNKTAKLRGMKKDRARFMTVMGELQILSQMQNGEEE